MAVNRIVQPVLATTPVRRTIPAGATGVTVIVNVTTYSTTAAVVGTRIVIITRNLTTGTTVGVD